MAYRRGEDSNQALVGALLEADGIYCQRRILAILEGYFKLKGG